MVSCYLSIMLVTGSFNIWLHGDTCQQEAAQLLTLIVDNGNQIIDAKLEVQIDE